MRQDSEAQTKQLLRQSQDPHRLHLEDDPRVMRAGRILRSLSIDELPQLVNMPKGEMSLVGPLYVTNWSVWLDIKLLLRTTRTVVTGRGAN